MCVSFQQILGFFKLLMRYFMFFFPSYQVLKSYGYFTLSAHLKSGPHIFHYLFICLFKNFFFFLAGLCSTWDLRSPTKDRTPLSLQWKRGVLTTGPTREVPHTHILKPYVNHMWLTAPILVLNRKLPPSQGNIWEI